MPRSARELSSTGIYHVMVRGINKQDIFLEQEDYRRYLGSLAVVRARSGCSVHGYCLLNNHVHLLLQVGDEGVGQVMQRLGTSYARWYNDKYGRVGHLFQDRFLSEPVEDDSYLLTVLRYIHRNPEKAGLASSSADYPWSSFRAYIGDRPCADGVTDTALVLGIIGGTAQFLKFSQAEAYDTSPLEPQTPERPEQETLAEIIRLLAGRPLSDLPILRKAERDLVIGRAKALSGATNAQIAELTGLPLSTVLKTPVRN